MKSMPHKKRRQKKNLLNQARWAGYAAAGAAAVLGTHEVADADIHYSGPVNVFLDASIGSDQQRSASWNVDLNKIGGPDIQMVHFGSTSGGVKLGAAFAFGQVAGTLTSSYRYASNLAYGTPIPGKLPFQSYGAMASFGGFPNDKFTGQGEGYVGFRFGSGDETQYGWVRVDMEGTPWNAFTVVDYAYADAGETILAGEVPEPGTLGLLATGAIGLLLWRRKRSQEDAA